MESFFRFQFFGFDTPNQRNFFERAKRMYSNICKITDTQLLLFRFVCLTNLSTWHRIFSNASTKEGDQRPMQH